MAELYGGIEAGGTKFVCAVGSGPGDIRDEVRFPTTTPEETLTQALDYFRKVQGCERLKGIGIATFGPVDPARESSSWGYITSTPKPGWRDVDFAGRFEREFEGVPIGFDTDVNGAALSEWRWGAGKGKEIVLYVTIGTGVGGGLVINGRPVHGLMHPEVGHMRLPHDRERDPYDGGCPFHGDCLEGLASGKAMGERWNQRGETLPDDHEAWTLEAEYLALMCNNLICTYSPQKVILGGGVMDHPTLIHNVRTRTQALLADYIQKPELMDGIEQYIVKPGLGNQAGVLGAIALARDAAHD